MQLLLFLQNAYELATSAGATLIIAVAGLALSAINSAYTILDKVASKRLRLATSYVFNGRGGPPSSITIVNLSPFAVHISHWCLKWKPTILHRFLSAVEVADSNAEDAAVIIIPAQNSYTLYFYDRDKFDTSYKTAQHRRLYLTLAIFGHSRKTLTIHRGM